MAWRHRRAALLALPEGQVSCVQDEPQGTAWMVQSEGEGESPIVSGFQLDEGGVVLEEEALLAPLDALFAASSRVIFAALPSGLAASVRRALSRREGCSSAETVTVNGPFRQWVAPQDCSRPSVPPSPPPGYRIEALREDHATVVDAHWKYRRAGTVDMIRRCIRDRPSACAMLEASDSPVAWAVTRADGSIGLVHTMEGHRRKGLASAVVGALVASLDPAVPYFYVAVGNEGSERVCKRLGFSPADGEEFCWVVWMRKSSG